MFKILVFLFPITVIGSLNVGTALYDVDDISFHTWTEEDLLMVRSRMLMDNLIPKNVVDGRSFLNYFKLIMKKANIIVNDRARRIAMVSVADAIGGYLQGVMLPRAKEAYYKGHENFDVTNELHALARKIKFILDTDGRGWMAPVDPGQPASADENKDMDDDPIVQETENPCAALLLYGEQSDGESAAVPLPAFDDHLKPGSIAFPFAVGKRLFAVDRPWLSADDRRPLLVRYYRLAAGCTSSAPLKFRADVHRWLESQVVPLLADQNNWYPVLAGATRVIRAAAKAASTGVTVDGRPKRGAMATATTTTTTGQIVPNDDEVDWSCDDEPNGRLPNVNMPLVVIVASLATTWLLFWAFRSKHQSQTLSFSRKPDAKVSWMEEIP